MAAEVAPIGGNRTTLQIRKSNNGIPQIPQSSRRSRELLRAESGPRVSHKALWAPAGKNWYFPSELKLKAKRNHTFKQM